MALVLGLGYICQNTRRVNHSTTTTTTQQEMALYLMNLLTKLTNNSCPDLPKVHLVKRTREELDQPLEAAPPTKIQKIDKVPEETIILFETETEYNERIKDEEIEKLKQENEKLKKSNEDKDEIIKILTQQLAAASKKTDAKYKIEVPLNFGVLNCN